MNSPTPLPSNPAPGLGRLLLATEHTEQDRGAEAVAFALARAGGAGGAGGAGPPVTLQAVMPLASNPEYETIAPHVAARAEAELAARRCALQAAASAAGVQLDLRVRRGSEPDADIVAEATERATELLVVRRRGKRGLLAQLLIGEMVSRVLAHAPCGVLVVPREAARWQHGVLACIDVDEQAEADASPNTDAATEVDGRPAATGTNEAVVAWAARAAAAAAVPLHLLCVVAHANAQPRGEAALVRARGVAEDPGRAGPPIFAALRVGPAHGRIVLAATECRADLIVLARGGGQWLGRAWLGSTTEKVIGQAPCPVLMVVPPRHGTPA
jgi:nucleotide-binding universal stress UspA family protein